MAKTELRKSEVQEIEDAIAEALSHGHAVGQLPIEVLERILAALRRQ